MHANGAGTIKGEKRAHRVSCERPRRGRITPGVLQSGAVNRARHTAFPSRHECDIEEFAALVEQAAEPADYPLAERLDLGVPVYDASDLAQGPRADGAEHRAALRDELSRALADGPGIVVLEGAVAPQAVERVSRVFWSLIERQRAAGGPAGDHFAKPGANDRLWNALEKLAAADPDAFIDYHRSDALAVVCEAWLGPRYQVTEQVNVVNPGGEAQLPHRDYHMGFLSDGEAERFPRHAHRLSPLLTLQGAVAHCDISAEAGATMYLPHSHKYELGYLAWRRPEFIEYFARHRVQLRLRAGDAVFFSPAMFHAAGHNRTTDVRRIANLLQISSAFGRATESVDRARMVGAVYPALRSRLAAGLDRAAAGNVVAACAEGYAFPINLDLDQPVDGLAPPSQGDLMNRGLDEDWVPQRLYHELALHSERHLSTGTTDSPAAMHNQAAAQDRTEVGTTVDNPAAIQGRTAVQDMLAQARNGARRLTPAELAAALSSGSDPGAAPAPLVIDIRDRDDRERTGMITGSVSIPLILLQWRCDPDSGVTHPAIKSLDQPLVTVCNQGYASSLAAASLRRLGFVGATDLEGGVEAWAEASLPMEQPHNPR